MCIEIHGSSIYMDRVTARWTNPPGGLTSATAHLREHGEEIIQPVTAHREGTALVAQWHPGETSNRSSEEVCVTIDGAAGRWACQDVISR
ncbi:hypothetical protein ACWC5I_19890 [Kitasatospora sp. NPDC001574]